MRYVNAVSLLSVEDGPLGVRSICDVESKGIQDNPNVHDDQITQNVFRKTALHEDARYHVR
jgi:hypothetical protein